MGFQPAWRAEPPVGIPHSSLDAFRHLTVIIAIDDSGWRCARIYEFVARREDETGTLLAWEATRGPVPTADVAFDGYDRGQGQLLEMVGERGWIHRTELMSALQRRMRGWPAVEVSADRTGLITPVTGAELRRDTEGAANCSVAKRGRRG
ncbi:hypothetical protein [Streptomyces sp. NPDC008141]|uniref:hypothetical protein n=1 Tax=Streptomyces sp. NPDC008141 TaxID=3364815 RepID=UPI0036E02524